jgi:hypothetical protein
MLLVEMPAIPELGRIRTSGGRNKLGTARIPAGAARVPVACRAAWPQEHVPGKGGSEDKSKSLITHLLGTSDPASEKRIQPTLAQLTDMRFRSAEPARPAGRPARSLAPAAVTTGRVPWRRARPPARRASPTLICRPTDWSQRPMSRWISSSEFVCRLPMPSRSVARAGASGLAEARAGTIARGSAHALVSITPTSRDYPAVPAREQSA